MNAIVITESARNRTKWTVRMYNKTLNEVRKTDKQEGVTATGISFKRLMNSIILF